MNLKPILFIVLLTILSPFVLSEGCFLYSNSELYCTNLDESSALQECSFFDDCNMTLSYFPNNPCENESSFPHCQQVMCKSTCQYQFRGKCISGEILPEENYEWCTPGCCQFTDAYGGFCNSVQDKWHCEIEASNKDATEYSYLVTSPEECAVLCEQGIIGGTTNPISLPPDLPDLPVNTKIEPPPPEEESNPNFMIGIIIVLVAIAIYLFYKEKTFSLKGIFPQNWTKSKPGLDLRLFSQFNSNPQTKLRIQQMQQEHQQKLKKVRQEELLREAGLTATPNNLRKLQHYVTNYELINDRKIVVSDVVLAKLRKMSKKK